MKVVIPARGLKIKRYPQGHLYQGYGENPDLYRRAVNVANCGLIDCRMQSHNGDDFAMAEGTDILATAGKVVDVKDTPMGYGKHVRILTDFDEDGFALEITYGHLGNIYTALGMMVKDEQVIGTMSNTGFIISGSTPYWGNAPAGKGVHLHITVRIVSKNKTDWPLIYMSGDRVYCLDYDNGVFGAVDPLPMIEEWLKERRKDIGVTLSKIIKILKRILNNLEMKSV